jgi:DNA processing protein
MNPLVLLLQLTLYGLKISDAEFEEMLSLHTPTWTSLHACVESPEAIEKIRDARWCTSVWEKCATWTKTHSLKWTHPGATDYPARLLESSAPPRILCYTGEPVWLREDLISVVGSREPSRDSMDWMRTHLLGLLQEHRLSVVSGGARGVDTWAHEISLLAGRPTVCFLPSGILKPYPAKNERLFGRILKAGGCLVSGFPPDAAMEKRYFHQRNRWIAGLSLVTFIVEAQRKSGSLLTARMALEEGRSICTLPVSPQAHQGQGNLDLLADGAQILRDQKDLELFLRQELSLRSTESPDADSEEQNVHQPK